MSSTKQSLDIVFFKFHEIDIKSNDYREGW